MIVYVVIETSSCPNDGYTESDQVLAVCASREVAEAFISNSHPLGRSDRSIDEREVLE